MILESMRGLIVTFSGFLITIFACLEGSELFMLTLSRRLYSTLLLQNSVLIRVSLINFFKRLVFISFFIVNVVNDDIYGTIITKNIQRHKNFRKFMKPLKNI